MPIRRELVTLALAFAAGSLAGWGRPGGDFLPLSLAGLVVLVVLAIGASSAPRALGRGLAFGTGECAVAFLGSLSWGAIVPLTLGALVLALRHAPLALFANWAQRSLGAAWGSAGVLALATLTQALSDALGFPQKIASVLVVAAPPLASGARLVGADVIGGVLAAACFASACALRARHRNGARAALLGAAPPLLGGLALLAALSALARATAPAPGRSVAAAVLQLDADSSYYRSRLIAPELRRRFAAAVEAQLRRVHPAELVVTTETHDGAFQWMLPELRARWAERARHAHQALLVTTYLAEANGKKSNAVAILDERGNLAGMHRKVQLAPFGEATLSAGSGFRPASVLGDVHLGVLVCLESYLSDGARALVRSGANLLVATTSDVTFGSTATVFEHLAGTQLRAIETGRAVVWASNAGPSGVIGRFGELSLGPFRETAALRVSAPTYAGVTPYVRFSGFWTALSAAVLGACAFRAVRRRPSREHPTQPLGGACRRPLLTAGAALLAGGAVIAASPALIEIRHGRAARAMSAMAEALRPPRRLVEVEDPYAPFRAEKRRSAEGAIAYLLTYYGLDSSVATLQPGLAHDTRLDAAASYVSRQYGVRLRALSIRHGAVPALAWLGELKDGSVVALDYAGEGLVHVFVPHWSRVLALPPGQLAELLGDRGFVPVHSE